MNKCMRKCSGCEQGFENQLGHVDGCLRDTSTDLYLYVFQGYGVPGKFTVELKTADRAILFSTFIHKRRDRQYLNAILDALNMCSEKGYDMTTINLRINSVSAYNIITGIQKRQITDYIYRGHVNRHKLNSVKLFGVI